MNNTGKVLLGVLAGAAAGAILGVLLAPEKGSETRKKIGKKGEDYADAIKGKFEELLDDMAERLATIREETGVMVANGESKVEEYKKEAKKAIG